MPHQLTRRRVDRPSVTYSRRRRLIAAFVAIQVVVPGAMLVARWVNEGSHPVEEYPLSWQMYSAVDSGTYIGFDEQQNEYELATDSIPPVVRGIGYGPTVPALLCETDPDLVAVAHVPADRLLEAQGERVLC